jgi:hypothetical protein
MTVAPSEEWQQANVRRIAELFEEKLKLNPTSTETIQISQSGANIRPAVLERKQRSLPRRAARFLIIFCLGVAATLAWQSYGNAMRESIARTYPQLGLLKPQTVGVGTIPEIAYPIAPGTASANDELLKSISVNIAAVRQRVDQLAGEFAASQQQTTSDIAKLKVPLQEPSPKPHFRKKSAALPRSTLPDPRP